jgi:hypothetical protein
VRDWLRKASQHRVLAQVLIVIAGCLAGCGGSAHTNATTRLHIFNARLSLTADCASSPSDQIRDPGCPYRPGHRPRPFDNPCGVTTDRRGYIYVASSGRLRRHEGRIAIFDPSGDFVTEISLPRKISERPCRIDVDSRGRIYIAARPMGITLVGHSDSDASLAAFRYAVLLYTPESYPPNAETKYGQPTVFALPGEVYGVAVDRHNGHVYAASGPVFEYNSAGELLNAASEIQQVAVGAGGGTFTLTLAGNTTMPIYYNASPLTVEKALERLLSIGRGNIVVRKKQGKPERYTVTFAGELTNREVEPLECAGAGLTGGVTRCTVTTTTQGSDGGLGVNGHDVAVRDRNQDVFVSAAGAEADGWVVNVYNAGDHLLSETIRNVSGDLSAPYPSIALDQTNGDVYVEDFTHHRIKQFHIDRESGKYKLLTSIKHGKYLNRPEAGADLTIDGSPASPNYGYLFVTSETRSGAHVYAFEPVAARQPRKSSMPGSR